MQVRHVELHVPRLPLSGWTCACGRLLARRRKTQIPGPGVGSAHTIAGLRRWYVTRWIMRLISKVVRSLPELCAAGLSGPTVGRSINIGRKVTPVRVTRPAVLDLIGHVLRFVRMTHTFAHYTGNSPETSPPPVNSGLRSQPAS